MTKIDLAHSSFLKKDFLAAFIIVVNTFSWYFPLYFFFKGVLESSQVGFFIPLVAISVHYLGAIGSAIVGVVLDKRFSRRSRFLSLWMFIGVISSIMLVALNTNNVAYFLLVSLLLGISLGLGFPSGLAYFGDHTADENRGRLGGVTFFASGLGMLLIGLLINLSTFALGTLIFAFWRGLGLILFHTLTSKQEHGQALKEVSYKSILLDRHFVLYLVPWIMFCLVNFLEFPIVTSFEGAEFVVIAEYGVGGFSALVCGWFADSVGRKRMIIFGFITLGIGYAILGLFSGITFSFYLYMILDGIAWGIFILMFYLVIWADLAGNQTKEKYYLIGVLPFVISGYIQILFTPYAESIPTSVAFSLASFFLFLAVLPLLYAPETLSEKQIELRRLRRYMEKAKQQVKEKASRGK